MAFSIVVIGTGIGGLAAAIALASRGHKVTVLEATAKLQAVGGIIVLQANASRVLDQWGIYSSFLKICREQPFEMAQRRYTGDVIARIPAEDTKKLHGYPFWNVHRGDYQRVLYEAAVQRGAEIRLGCPVVSVDVESTEPSVVLKSGEVVRADIIIGADGMKSITRDAINAEPERGVTDSGVDITRFNIPKKVLDSDPLTAEMAEELALWHGPDTGLASVPILHDGNWYNGYDALHMRCENSTAGLAKRRDLADLKRMYAHWGPHMQKLLSYVDEVYVWQINETMPAKWVSKSGRVALLGDACHAVVPNVGQGGGLALEDAATLAECLARASPNNKHEIPKLLRAYQAIREARCKMVQAKGRWLKANMMLHDGPVQQARDEKLRNFKAWQYGEPWDGKHIDELPAGLMAPNYMSWQNGHDARLFANRKLDQMFGTAPAPTT